ncbi:BCCT family transporter [Psittacicella hinzii]|uniref:Transporter n=1 Tax=Psittacicella hinzii TaxID=2028575 RepID=A0A3A1YH62_9GAMM|nr:BCCT family transporter [Psittacicella hinzii]RIY36410.1 transporter [Psittacicella hinzii]
MSLGNFIKRVSTFNPLVISITLLLVITLVLSTIFLPTQVSNLLNMAQQGIFTNFSWFYVLAFSLFVGFLLVLCFSSVGNIKLGAEGEEPEFSFHSWMAMLFAAGMGVGIMFFGVAEPLTHFNSSIAIGSPEQKAQEAMLQTFFHWGIHAWAVYAVIALALAYFGFRYKLPLSLRSCFYPLLKDRINGKIGDIIDVFALISTMFGIITTLGFGAMQLGAGLKQIGVISDNSYIAQVIIIVVVMSIAIISAISGVGKGVKILSEINLVLALLLLVFILCAGPTLYILYTFSDNLGTYLSNIVDLSFKAFAYEQEHSSWFTGWTVFYWSWWAAWSPFVGLFIARISRGRTIREFVFGVLAVPSLFCVLWFTVFGDSALWLDSHQAQGALSELTGSPEVLLFKFLDYLPLPTLISVLSLVIISLFFITSADSGIYVLNNFASRDKSLAAPKWQAAMFGIIVILIAVLLLRTGGLGALQSMTLIVALPFTALLILMCFSLWRGLATDQKYFAAPVEPAASSMWDVTKWRDRLGQILTQTQEKDTIGFLKQTALPAMRELKQELVSVHNLSVEINQALEYEQPAVELIIHKENFRDFKYGIKAVAHDVAPQVLEDGSLNFVQHEQTWHPETYFFDGRQGYDVQYMSRNELIADMLQQYERYLSTMSSVGKDFMAHEEHELAE